MLENTKIEIGEIKQVLVRQRKELVELFGFETRNKYEISDTKGNTIAFAAEQGKGLLHFLARMFLGHWRPYKIILFNPIKKVVLKIYHPFRWWFKRLEVRDGLDRNIGSIQQRFSIFSKKFDYEDSRGEVIFTVNSSLLRIWTFPIMKGEQEVARIEKKWSGILKETFTDADNFLITFIDHNLTEKERLLILASSIFVDMRYFEKKAGSK